MHAQRHHQHHTAMGGQDLWVRSPQACCPLGSLTSSDDLNGNEGQLARFPGAYSSEGASDIGSACSCNIRQLGMFPPPQGHNHICRGRHRGCLRSASAHRALTASNTTINQPPGKR